MALCTLWVSHPYEIWQSGGVETKLGTLTLSADAQIQFFHLHNETQKYPPHSANMRKELSEGKQEKLLCLKHKAPHKAIEM